MLSDEEKKAIKEVKHFNQLTRYWQEEEYEEKEIAEYITIVLNLIEKQSKEIEELSDKLTQRICKGVEEEILEEYRQTIISKDKEIEEYKKQLDLDNECEIALNSKVMDLEKEIEELKDTRSIFNMGRRNYKNEIEDKIKAKIEEKFLEAKGLYERGVQPQAQYTMKLLRDLEKSLLEKE